MRSSPVPDSSSQTSSSQTTSSQTTRSQTTSSQTNRSGQAGSQGLALGDWSLRRLAIAGFSWIASVMVHTIFVPAMLATLWTSHFLSFVKIDSEPKGKLPGLIASNMDTLDALALASAVLLGTTTLLRLRSDSWKGPTARLGFIAFVPVLVESLAYSVQEGTTHDLELVAVHSLVLLVFCVATPVAASMFDLWRLKHPKLFRESDAPFAQSRTIEQYKNRARESSGNRRA